MKPPKHRYVAIIGHTLGSTLGSTTSALLEAIEDKVEVGININQKAFEPEPLKIKAHELIDETIVFGPIKSGRELRRERRKQKRKNK
jgi:hypothetical protein